MNDLDYPLRFLNAPEVIATLKVLPRTGWVQWNIVNPETVYEHIVATRALAVRYQNDLALSAAELQELLDMLEVHDWPEALVGDGVILGDEENVGDLKKQKQTRELEAMKTICAPLINGDDLLALYVRYQQQTDPIAKLAKEIEKFQAVVLAREYESCQKKSGLTAEFFYYTKNLIHHPFLKKEFKKIAMTISVFSLYVALPLSHYTYVVSGGLFKSIAVVTGVLIIKKFS